MTLKSVVSTRGLFTNLLFFALVGRHFWVGWVGWGFEHFQGHRSVLLLERYVRIGEEC
jgi:hypothetical protein